MLILNQNILIGSYFRVTLQRAARFSVDIYYDTIWITGKIDADFDLDLRHFLVNFRLTSFY